MWRHFLSLHWLTSMKGLGMNNFILLVLLIVLLVIAL